MDTVKLIWNPFSPTARALTAELRGNYGQALRWYAKAQNGEELVTERFCYGLPACPIRQSFIQAACALIRLERAALRIEQPPGTSSSTTAYLTQRIEDAADDLWRRAHRFAHASSEAGVDVMDALYGQERVHLQQLVQAIKAFHSELVHLQFAGTSPLQDQAARFTSITHAARGLAQRDEEDD